MGHDIITLVSVLIGSSGLVGAVIAFYKLKPETGQLMVTTAQGVVIIQTGVIESLREELDAVRAETRAVKAELKQTIIDCAAESEGLRQRIRDLEAINGRPKSRDKTSRQ